ncbi:hypothetical protein IWW52_005043, partial [Coemansia sp. RSA 2704]
MVGETKTLRILHFNDVYHVAAAAQEPVGGAGRFGRMVHQLQQAGPALTLFSGDAYFPSLESTISRGEHMVPVLNRLNIDASTLGNHEFDHGLEVLEGLIGRNNFPWVITNLTDKATGGPAAQGSVAYVVKEQGGVRVGIIGVVEREWLDTLPCLPPTFVYHDFVESAREMARRLKGEMGCDVVVCLSHMRLNNDQRLADACAEVDVVLSGHDHFYYVGSGVDEYEDPDLARLPEKYSGDDDDRQALATWTRERAELAAGRLGHRQRRLVKSGTDFRDLSEIVLTLGPDGRQIRRMRVTRHRTLGSKAEDAEIGAMVSKIEAHLSRALDKPVGYTTVELDARSSVCRTRESNVGSLAGDLMRMCYAESCGAQIALLCGGAIRSDKVFAAGAVRMRDIMELFPFEDPVVVVRLRGAQIWQALENGVSLWPAHEGRFPQVSGIRFAFDPRRPAGQRVTRVVVTAAAARAAARSAAAEPEPESDGESEPESDGEPDEELDLQRQYVVATRAYMYRGHDGYTALSGGSEVVDEENGITFADLFRRYFAGLAVCSALEFRRSGGARRCAAAAARSDESDTSGAWRRLIIKHADNLRALAQEQQQQQAAHAIAGIVDGHSAAAAQRAARAGRRGSRIGRALADSARRVGQDPLQIARAALFGRGGQTGEESGRSTPRNDDADGLLPRLPINRSDTRTHASEGVLARWA